MKFLIPPYKHLGKFWKTTQKAQNNRNQVKRSSPFLINDNFRFEANDFELLMIPKHPKLASGKERAIVIDKQSIVLELLFLRKSQNTEQDDKILEQSQNFDFKFDHLSSILDIHVGNGQIFNTFRFSSILQNFQQSIIKITDNTDKRRVNFIKYNEILCDGSTIKTIKTQFQQNISYEDFSILQNILKECLYDLSGTRLILDLKRIQQLEALQKTINQEKKSSKEAQQFYT